MAEWQIWGASNVAHLIDATRTASKRSGVKARCGRYTGKGVLSPFFALHETEAGVLSAVRSYNATPCEECLETSVSAPDDSYDDFCPTCDAPEPTHTDACPLSANYRPDESTEGLES